MCPPETLKSLNDPVLSRRSLLKLGIAATAASIRHIAHSEPNPPSSAARQP